MRRGKETGPPKIPIKFQLQLFTTRVLGAQVPAQSALLAGVAGGDATRQQQMEPTLEISRSSPGPGSLSSTLPPDRLKHSLVEGLAKPSSV